MDRQLFDDIEPDDPLGPGVPAQEPPSEAGAPVAARVRPTPHRSKLVELTSNAKAPQADREAAAESLERYDAWIAAMASLTSAGDEKVRDLVSLLNAYKRHIELELIWDSRADFLFRQRGQLKLDNSIIEEFLPWLVDPAIIPQLAQTDVFAGPASAFAAASFSTTLTQSSSGVGLRTRTKDQDFTLSRPAYLAASFEPDFPPGATDVSRVWLAYLAAECKTNLDKTMFQEASATSHDLKVAIPAARYYLICEYLDMTPISSVGTAIDEVLILRGKRLASNKRAHYSTSANRIRLRSEYLDYLEANPVREDVVQRFVDHVRDLFTASDPSESDAIDKGYF